MIKAKSIFTLLFFALAATASAQKVGLVLSGGGAKGLYHIGVIKALEENDIPIDYVSGTSMGSIIGGLYAIGYTPEMMSEIFLSDRVKSWMSGKISEKYAYYFKQMQPNAAMISLRLDLHAKGSNIAQLPTNLVPPYLMDMAFVEFFSAATAQSRGNFDNLFVPFRCVASDAAARHEVIFRGGDLGKAIRASMTIPLVFKPLKMDSTLLYDGGIYNNFPWQVLQEDFHPDILIGSKCAGNSKPDENSALDQLFALTMMHTDYTLPSKEDILIEHTFDDVSTLDFNKAAYVIDCGYRDAIAMMPEILERIKRREPARERYARRLDYTSRLPELVFHDYTVTGLNPAQTSYVRKLIGLDSTRSKNHTFDYDQFRNAYFKLLSEGEVDGSYPQVVYDTLNNLFDLSIDMRTKPSFKVMFGGNISSTSLNQAYVGLEYKRIGKQAQTYTLDGYFSPFYTSAYLGGRTDFYLRRQPLYVDFGLRYNYYNYFRSDYGLLSKHSDLTYSKYSDAYFTTSIGTPVQRNTVLFLRANVGRDTYRYEPEEVSDSNIDLDRTRFSFVDFKLEVERDERNYVLYPTRGIYQNSSLTYVTGVEDFRSGDAGIFPRNAARKHRSWFGAEFKREQYWSLGKFFSLGYMAQGVITTHPDFRTSLATNMSLPAFTPTPHSNLVYLREFRSQSYAALGLMPTIEFTPKFYLKSSVYAFMPDHYGQTVNGIYRKMHYIFNSSLVYQTFIGPVSLSVSKYDVYNNKNWFITFNFGYTLFKPKGLFY